MKDIALHILDLAQNSIRAEASKIEIRIDELTELNEFNVTIEDNGKGMDEEFAKQVTDPFVTSRTTRKVGLGLSLMKQNAEQCNGSLNIDSRLGEGTKLYVKFEHDNIDRPALGDIAGTVVLIAAANPEIEIKYVHTKDGKEYIFDTCEVNEALEGMEINDPQIRGMLIEMILENLKDIHVLKHYK